jgi:two-component system, chemotaxis family, chemotaxis protein CheY
MKPGNIKVLVLDQHPGTLAYFKALEQKMNIEVTALLINDVEISKLQDEFNICFLDLDYANSQMYFYSLKDKKTPVYCLTISEENPDIKKCVDLGASGYLIKPPDFEKVTTALQQGEMINYFEKKLQDIILSPMENESQQTLISELLKSIKSQEYTNTDGSGPFVMVVDDSRAIRKLISTTLTSADYKVIEAQTGHQALSGLKKNSQIECVLLDLIMPGMDGFEVILEMKKDPDLRNIPIMMLTTEGQEANQLKGKKLGATEFLVKPFEPQYLLDKLDNLVKKTA